MSVPLRVLIVEDRLDDTEAMLHELQRAGFAPDWQRVETEADFLAGLHPDLDVILAAFALPHFGALDALRHLRAHELDIPLIVVTRRMGEEAATACMKLGAADYVLKDRLTHLGEAVARARADHQQVRDRQRAVAALRESEARWRHLAEQALDVIFRYRLRPAHGFEYVNPAVTTICGYTPDELYADPDLARRMIHADDRHVLDAWLQGDVSGPVIVRWIRRDGTTIWVEQHNTLVRDEVGVPVAVEGIARDVSARVQSEQRLRQERDRTQQYLDIAGVIMVVINPDQTVSLINRKGCEVLGCAAEDVIGRNWFDTFIPQRMRERVRETFATLMAGNLMPVEYFENPVLTADGTERLIAWHNTLLIDEAGRISGTLSSGEDITERKQAEELLYRLNRAYRTLSECNQIVVRSTDEADMLQRTCQAIAEIGGYPLVWIGLVEEGTTRIVRPVARAGDQSAFLDAITIALDDRQEGSGPIARAIRNAQPHVVRSIATDPGAMPWRRAALQHGFGSAIALPLLVDGQAIGALTLFAEKPDAFDAEEIKLLGELAGDVAYGIGALRTRAEHQRAQEAEREQRILAEALSHTAATINSTLNLDAVLDGILAGVGCGVPYDCASIMLVDSGATRIVRHRGYAERGLAAWIESLRWPVQDLANLRTMAETGAPLAIPDVRAYPEWRPVPETDWIRSYAAAPIRVEGELVGFLNLDHATPGFYTQAHAERLQAFADQAAIAIRNARLYDTVQRHAAELERRVAERTRELAASEARYRAIVEDQTELICRYLPDGTLTFANQACCRYFDQPADALIGRNFFTLIADEDRATLEQQLAALGPKNPVATTDHRVIAPGGELRWVQWTTRVILDERGSLVELQGVGRDITERRRAEEVLRRALVREMELNEIKSRFVSLVSHEFRNPLAVMLMNADVLKRYDDRLSAADKAKYLDSIQAFIRHMGNLLDDLLTISRSEAGKLEFKPQPLDFQTFCQGIIDEVRTTLGPTLTFDYSASGDCQIVGDEQLLRLIVGNLVSNAAKYSPPGATVTVTVECGETVILRVQDRGIGIPEADQPHVFEMFHRAQNVGRVAGTGLGLAITRQCVEQHGGTIAFESQEGVGTTFTVRLPRLPFPAQPAANTGQ